MTLTVNVLLNAWAAKKGNTVHLSSFEDLIGRAKKKCPDFLSTYRYFLSTLEGTSEGTSVGTYCTVRLKHITHVKKFSREARSCTYATHQRFCSQQASALLYFTHRQCCTDRTRQRSRAYARVLSTCKSTVKQVL